MSVAQLHVGGRTKQATGAAVRRFQGDPGAHPAVRKRAGLQVRKPLSDTRNRWMEKMTQLQIDGWSERESEHRSCESDRRRLAGQIEKCKASKTEMRKQRGEEQAAAQKQRAEEQADTQQALSDTKAEVAYLKRIQRAAEAKRSSDLFVQKGLYAKLTEAQVQSEACAARYESVRAELDGERLRSREQAQQLLNMAGPGAPAHRPRIPRRN